MIDELRQMAVGLTYKRVIDDYKTEKTRVFAMFEQDPYRDMNSEWNNLYDMVTPDSLIKAASVLRQDDDFAPWVLKKSMHMLKANMAAKVMINIIMPRLNSEGIDIKDIPIKPDVTSKIVSGIVDGNLTFEMAKKAIDRLWNGEQDTDSVIEEIQKSAEPDGLDEAINEVLAKSEAIVKQIKDGNQKAIGALIGAVKKQTGADASIIKDKILSKI